MGFRLFVIWLGTLCLPPMVGAAFTGAASPRSAPFRVRVISAKDGKPLQAAVTTLAPYGLWAVAGTDGEALFADVPPGKAELSVSLLGYETVSLTVELKAETEDSVRIAMMPSSFAMKEVVVVAENNKSGLSTSSSIGRQALDHLQATSLKDVLQLLPGNFLGSNPSLISTGQFRNRTLEADNNNAFGGSIVVDGIPLSNNANLNVEAGAFSTAGKGIDLRGIGTDNIESIEVIRGIASARYGDMSSGTMLIKSKVGRTPGRVLARIMPGIQQLYADKGFDLGRAGTLNLSADYAHGKSDPRYATDTYNRGLLSLIHSKNLADGRWAVTTRLGLKLIRDWSGADPGEPELVRGMYAQSRQYGITFSHSGRFGADRLLMRSLHYDIGFSYSRDDDYQVKMLAPAAHNAPVFNATGNSTQQAAILPSQYVGRGGTDGRPISFYVQLGDDFYLGQEGFLHRIAIGAELRSEGNLGRGFYNENPNLPLAQLRSRSFRDIPFLTQFSLYGEDQFDLKIGKTQLKVQAGLRWTLAQPGRTESLSSVMPRINAAYLPTRGLRFRFGYGISAKMPGLLYLYPDPGYLDMQNISATIDGTPYVVYTTRVYDLTNEQLKPMKNRKFEAGADVTLHNGMRFSVTAFHERVNDGFGTLTDEWIAPTVARWASSAVSVEDGKLAYDPQNPTSIDTVLHRIDRPGNCRRSVSRGIEYDFELGRIEATGTSFYLNGSYIVTRNNSSNKIYNTPVGSTTIEQKTMVVYPEGSSTSVDRRYSTALRIVQHIPSIRFVVSATVQAIFYEYNRTINIPEIPVGYVTVDRNHPGATVYVPFTAAQLADPEARFEGFMVKDQIYKSQISNLPETWPPLWSVNLRVTKEVGNGLGFSFYVNNVFFKQPWHKSSISTTLVERNSNLFSYGFEINASF